jgi:predicted ribosome quality control (RQC) complex YloA/Tae2 family protein
MNSAANEFYFMRDRYARMRDRSSSITKVVTNNLRRAEKKLNILQCELKEAGKREYFRICGDIISANLYRIQKGDTVLKAQNFYDENQAERKCYVKKD